MMLQHPEITWAEQTGYPSFNQPTSIYCCDCGNEITDETIYEDDNYEFLCEYCLKRLHRKEW